MIDLTGKWALVTGASRGLGRLAAICLAQHGCSIAAHSRKAAHTDDLVHTLQNMGVQAFSVSAELSDNAAIARMLSEIDEKADIDIVLNNAGVQLAYRTDYLNTPITDYTDSFQINTIAPMMICYHYIPKMLKKGFGRIVNTTSGIRLEPEQAGYSASKAALDKVTVDLGSKLEGTGVMLNLTDPGWCRTELGGPKAPNSPESAVPGVVLGAFLDDGISGRLFCAQDYKGMTLEEAVQKAQR